MSRRSQEPETRSQNDYGDTEDKLDFTNMADSLREMFEKLSPAIETGAQLQQLSLSTSEAVSKLYEFQRGLEAVGVKDKYLPAILGQMHEALSGSNANDEYTLEAFRRLGLNPNQLHKEDAVDVVTQIAGAMRRLDPNHAEGTALQLFPGWNEMDSILQIGRNIDLFEKTMHESAGTGQMLEKFTDSFHGMKAEQEGLKNDRLGIQAAMAGMLAPLIQNVFDAVHGNIKNIGPTLSGATQSREVSDLLWTVINTALDKLERRFKHSIIPESGGNADHPQTANVRNTSLDTEKSHFKPEFTSLEKMGFVMSGGKVQNPYDQRKVDLLQQIAHNTSPHQTQYGTNLGPRNVAPEIAGYMLNEFNHL